MARAVSLFSIFLSLAFACCMAGYYFAVRRPDEVVEVRLRRLVVPVEEGNEDEAKERAQKAADAIREGKPFAEAAQEAGDPFAERTQGEMGYVRRGLLEKNLEEAAFSAPILQVQGPLKTEAGYAVFVVVEKRMRY